MNDTLKTILSRRSIRKYNQEQIKDDELQAILEAGTYAPSAMNQQPWHITVIQNKEILLRLNKVCIDILIQIGNKHLEEKAKTTNVEDIDIMYNAPTLIIVSGNEKAIAPQNDCSLVLENMFLAAESLGIGSCWINAMRHLHITEEGKSLLKEIKIPEGYTVVGSGIFGYKECNHPSPAQRREGTITIIK